MESKENVLRKEIGERITYIRKQKKMTKADFAKLIGSTSQQLCYVEKGERGFSISKLLEISKMTGFPIEFILTGKRSCMEEAVEEKLRIVQKQLQLANDIINSICTMLN